MNIIQIILLWAAIVAALYQAWQVSKLAGYIASGAAKRGLTISTGLIVTMLATAAVQVSSVASFTGVNL